MLTDQELQSLRNMGNEAEAAADEIMELRRDAARYRWLRSARPDKLPHGKGRSVLLGFDALDVAIDAAIAHKEPT